MSKESDDRITSEEEYRTIFEAASDGLIIYDIEDDLVVEANPAACVMHGYTRAEFIGLNPAVFILPESHAQFREHVQTITADATIESLVIHKRKDDSLFHAEVRRSAIHYRSRPCLLSVIRDVSHRIQTETILSEQVRARLR